MTGNVYCVSCEFYDKTWFVTSKTKKKALSIVKNLTEEYGWHLDYPEEQRVFKCDRVFTKLGVAIASDQM